MENSTPVARHPFYIRLAAILLSVVLILLLLEEGRVLFVPLFFSLLIAFMLLPLTKWLERRRLPRGLAAIVSVLLFVCIIGGLFSLLAVQVTQFSEDLPGLGTQLQGLATSFQKWIALKYHMNIGQQSDYLNKAAADIARVATLMAQAAVVAISGFAIWTIFVLIFAFFILTHRTLLAQFLTSLFKWKDQPQVAEALTETRLLANGYVVGLLIEMVIVAVLNVALLAIFGIKYALLLGLLAAVLNIIPYIGIYSATAVAALVTVANSSPNAALIVIAILLAVHFIDANVLMPRIVGSRVKMNPLITIVAVLAGSHLWGIAGMFLFIPLAGILKIVFERVNGLAPWALLMGTEGDEKG